MFSFVCFSIGWLALEFAVLRQDKETMHKKRSSRKERTVRLVVRWFALASWFRGFTAYLVRFSSSNTQTSHGARVWVWGSIVPTSLFSRKVGAGEAETELA